MDSEAEVGQLIKETDREFIPVDLIRIGKRPLRAEVAVEGEMGGGESFIVKRSLVKISQGERTRQWPSVMKVSRYEDRREQHQSTVNKYYNAFVLRECLRRAGVTTVPTCCLAVDTTGKVLGILETDLRRTPLKKVGMVPWLVSPREDSLALRVLTRGDRQKAEAIGIKLAKDTWILQLYPGVTMPTPVANDFLEAKVDWGRFSRFLSREKNKDIVAYLPKTDFAARAAVEGIRLI